MKRQKSTNFKALQKKWYNKLRRSGFKDIEDESGRFTDHRHHYDFSLRHGFRTEFFESIRDYYIWAEHMVTRGEFKSRMDKTIWRLHSQGKSTWTIGEHVSFDQKWICRKIKKIRDYLRTQWDEEDEG